MYVYQRTRAQFNTSTYIIILRIVYDFLVNTFFQATTS